MDDEVIEISLHRGDAVGGLGFNIRGGVDTPHIEQDTGIFVTKIRENGAAHLDGRLKEGDKILMINGQSLENLSHREAVRKFQAGGNFVHLKILKDAERKTLERTNKTTMKRYKSNGSKEVFLYGAASVVILGVVGYIFKDSIRSVFSRILKPSQPDYNGVYFNSRYR